MTATPWVRSLSVREAAEALHIGLADVAELVVEGRLRARVRPDAERPNIWTVDVSAADVRRFRADGFVSPCPVVDPVADELRAQELLRRRRARTGWLVDWRPPGRGGHPSTRRMGVTGADRVREVRAMLSRLGGRNDWVRLSLLSRLLAKREWGKSEAVRDVVDQLINDGVVIERLRRPTVGRPSPEIRFADKES